MTHFESVRELVSVLQPEDDGRPTVLLGAGASFSSGVPMADEAVKRIARRVFAEKFLGGKVLPEQVKTSEWRAWLSDRPWFIRDEGRLAENFPLVVRHLLEPASYRQKILLDLMRPTEAVGAGYRHLSELVLRGLLGTVLTTNFDICLPKALNGKLPHLRFVAEVWRNPADDREFDIFNRAQIVWLHGKAEQYSDRNLTEEVASLDPKLIGMLLPLLRSTPLIVVGYRGAEPSIMDCLLGDAGDLAFRKGIYWCHMKGAELHPNVEKLAQRLGGNFRLLEIGGFDELLADLDRELAGRQRALGRPVADARPDFDDRPAAGATLSDLDLDLALHTAHIYARKLGLPEPSAATLNSFLRELGLLTNCGGIETPSLAAVLLFGVDPQRYLPHAVVTVTIDGKKRRVVSGNLMNQRAVLLDLLAQKDVNPILKVKVKGRHVERPAYHERALVELLTNLLVHRDYEDGRLSSVEIESARSISFANPGRPEGILGGLKVDERGRFEPVRELTSPRNRALCDVFYGVSAMERAGTGLSDVVDFAREGDGTAVFRLPPGGDEFRAELFQPAASGKTSSVARDLRPVGTYFVNILPFAAMPDAVSRVCVRGRLADIAKSVPLEDAGTLLLRGDELWSLAPAALLGSLLRPVMTEASVRSTPRIEIEANPDLARVFSWLLRKHFEGRLRSLHHKGLIIEQNRPSNRRAYFVGREGKPRQLVYNSPNRRNIVREVVKQRGEKPRAWFENEGFAYGIERLGGTWGVRVKPFYMFTGPDAATPLPGYARTAKATRRMKFDRNQSVETDLVFWARFISQGSPVVNLGQAIVDDLLLEGAFLSLDVSEEGLLDVGLDSDEESA
jgi:hypothetical protein